MFLTKRFEDLLTGGAPHPEEGGFVVREDIAEALPVQEPVPEKHSWIAEVFEWLDVIVAAMIAVVLIFSLFFRVATIDGDSMMNTLLNGQKVIITRLGYTPAQGDIVVVSRNYNNSINDIKSSKLPIIKRVIAVAGQTVNIDFDRGVVSVDGVELKEPYTRTPTNRRGNVEFPVYVPEGYVFVMGDNRNDSLDSRFNEIGDGGLIDTHWVLGHAVYRVFPINTAGRLDQ